MSFETERMKVFKDLCTGINQFKKCCQAMINSVKVENCDQLADSLTFWYVSVSYWMYMGLMMLGRLRCIDLSH
jgi:hypothetical protein